MVGIILGFGYLGYRKGLMKEIISLGFWLFGFVLVGWLTPHVSQFLQNQTPVYQWIEKGSIEYVANHLKVPEGLSKGEEMVLIDSLPLPKISRLLLQNNNTESVYGQMGIGTFREYLGSVMAKQILGGLTFLLTLFLVGLLARAVILTVDIMEKIPVIKGANRIGGFVLGAIKGILVAVLFMIVLAVFRQVPGVDILYKMIGESSILDVFYQGVRYLGLQSIL